MKKFKPDTSNDKGGYDNMVDIEEESPALINTEIDFGDKLTEKENENKDDNKNQDIISNILVSNIAVDEWQRELERVSAKIKIDFNNNNFANVEWRSHIEQIKTNEAV